LGRRFEKMLTWRETEYFSGNLSLEGAVQCMSLWPILPQQQQYMSNLSYFRKSQRDSPPSLRKEKPGFKGLLTSISTRNLRKLLKVFFITTNIIYLDEISQTFTNRNDNFCGHIDQRKSMDLDPKGSYMEG
jgi:hypothetical protein